ncbi:MAG: glycoside hydrolase N-terminal domain-containing protein [Treponema sp.]|jgi:alpha-L-fucosidase 2|nr:glycoside hydrolase N-terminal domain-containing protein [Treponema sp.]
MNTLFYKTPSTIGWMEGLPVGNGRLAAMSWQDGDGDVLTINHEWLWRGVNRNRKPEDNAGQLEFVRSLLKKGDYFRAGLFANLYFAGNGGISAEKGRVDSYQPAAELRFQSRRASPFVSRSLDIRRGIATVERGPVTATVFADCVSGLVYASWKSGGVLEGELGLSRPEDSGAGTRIEASPAAITLDCAFHGGISYRLTAEITTDGTVAVAAGGRVSVSGASYLCCAVNVGTSVKGIDEELGRYRALDAAEAERRHVEKFSAVMDRVVFELESPAGSANLSLPVEERVALMKKGAADNGLCALYYHFGRYLLVSSAISGELPPNLQGKWNDRIDPSWDCDYHFDINLQMNHWPAEPCNMGECADKLLRYAESFYESGAAAAKSLYGCRGIYLPIQTDAWGVSTPESFGWAVWIGAAPWIAWHFWQRYVYSGDKEFLKNRAYRFFREVARFYEDYLVEDEQGVFQIMPSQSPENTFAGAGHANLPVTICVSSAMDVQLCYDALGYAIDAAEILGLDEEKVAAWKDIRRRLPPFGIGSDGRLLEWNEEKKEPEPGHRHVSHLYGVYPSEIFTAEKRPAHYEAALKALEYRLGHGGGHSGWSRSWAAALMARFGKAEGFYEHYTALIKDFATMTLLDTHPMGGWTPPVCFQIDGNFGGVAAVNEALVRCVDGKIHILPALPKAWPGGAIKGIKTPGGHTVDIVWNQGKAVSADITLGFSGEALVRVNGGEQRLRGDPGSKISVRV